MPNKKEILTSPKFDKKALRKQIAEKLHGSLSDLKNELGEKKFGSRIKKAARLITDGIKVSQPKSGRKKTAKKKAAVKKIAAAEPAAVAE